MILDFFVANLEEFGSLHAAKSGVKGEEHGEKWPWRLFSAEFIPIFELLRLRK